MHNIYGHEAVFSSDEAWHRSWVDEPSKHRNKYQNILMQTYSDNQGHIREQCGYISVVCPAINWEE